MDAVVRSHPFALAAAAGVATHICINRYTPKTLSGLVSVAILPPTLLVLASKPTSAGAIALSIAGSFLTYWLALAASTCAYRLSPFHPLAKYPGPVLAKLSRFWTTKLILDGDQHTTYHALHERYGEIVRTGPNHLIIRNVSAVPTVLGPGKGMWHNGARYDVVVPPGAEPSLVTMTENTEKSKRRRMWEPAFTPTAVKSYQPMLEGPLSALVTDITNKSSKEIPVQLQDALMKVAFNFMGMFAYGGALPAEETGWQDIMIHAGLEGTAWCDVFGATPWIRPILPLAPSTKVTQFHNAAAVAAENRRRVGSKFRDLMFYLINDSGELAHTGLSGQTLAMEASTALVAGSDTTATTMTNAFYYMLTNPATFTKLRAELDAAAGEGTAYEVEIEAGLLDKLAYLNAVINETLRLQPAVPGGSQREPPAEAGTIIVAGYPIPPGTTCQIPTWSLHRDTRYFSPRTETFWPERWTPEGAEAAKETGEEFNLVQAAYMPFSYGPGNCLGRILALKEMRAVIATLVRRFDMRFPADFDGRAYEGAMKDRFVLNIGKLPVIVTPRA